MDIRLKPDQHNEVMGVVQLGKSLDIISYCCGSEMPTSVASMAYICNNCGQKFSLLAAADDKKWAGSADRFLGTTISVNASSSTLRWWIKKWTDLDVDVEVS